MICGRLHKKIHSVATYNELFHTTQISITSGSWSPFRWVLKHFTFGLSNILQWWTLRDTECVFFLNWYPNIWHLYFKVKNFSIFHKIMLLHTHTVNKTDCHFYTSFSKSHKLSNTHSHSCHCPKQHLFVSYTSTSSSYSAEKLFKFETW